MRPYGSLRVGISQRRDWGADARAGRRRRRELLDSGFLRESGGDAAAAGWSLATIYYHTSVSAGADVARAREITTGRIPINLSASLTASLDAKRFTPDGRLEKRT